MANGGTGSSTLKKYVANRKALLRWIQQIVLVGTQTEQGTIHVISLASSHWRVWVELEWWNQLTSNCELIKSNRVYLRDTDAFTWWAISYFTYWWRLLVIVVLKWRTEPKLCGSKCTQEIFQQFIWSIRISRVCRKKCTGYYVEWGRAEIVSITADQIYDDESIAQTLIKTSAYWVSIATHSNQKLAVDPTLMGTASKPEVRS